MVFIVYCPEDEKGIHDWEIDKSRDGVLLRCRKCNMFIVNLPKPKEDKKK